MGGAPPAEGGAAIEAGPPSPDIRAVEGLPRHRSLRPTATMPLSAADKANVKAVWSHVSSHPEAFGAECLNRLFASNPSTKTYFAHMDTSPDSADVKKQGKKIIDALTLAVNHMDDLHSALGPLSELHAQKLRVDPTNFGLLNHNILVTIAVHNGGPLKPELQVSCDKFLTQVSKELTCRYR
ncbi:hemoglobin subunit alpha-1-like [Hemicordylus capensis]|uniref:hemoglobin subunit alpha-1-like n=1 Tax=Hemicordylus capensis TaxID=884348 RepID=UPI0023040E04|nr:hemoglobin subunit alpha-1-like [Hemicordylus capensis]